MVMKVKTLAMHVEAGQTCTAVTELEGKEAMSAQAISNHWSFFKKEEFHFLFPMLCDEGLGEAVRRGEIQKHTTEWPLQKSTKHSTSVKGQVVHC